MSPHDENQHSSKLSVKQGKVEQSRVVVISFNALRMWRGRDYADHWIAVADWGTVKLIHALCLKQDLLLLWLLVCQLLLLGGRLTAHQLQPPGSPGVSFIPPPHSMHHWVQVCAIPCGSAILLTSLPTRYTTG